MTDSNNLKVLTIFETSSRLKLSSEISCLAAHIYHRFFKQEQIYRNVHLFELNTVAAASIELAAYFYEKKQETGELCLAIMDLIQGPGFYVDKTATKNLIRSIKLMAKVMTINLDFQINYKDTRWATPGILNQQHRDRNAVEDANRKPIINISSSDESSSSSEDEDDSLLTKADVLLSKNDRYQISCHRYLTHFLKCIKMLVKPEALVHLTKISNIAWSILSDFHWSPCVTGIYANHQACASLMMAIEVVRVELEKSRHVDKIEFWRLINKKWHLIFCDDLSDDHLQRAIDTIIEQYQEYERVLQHELNTYVLDPLRR